jgi:catechol 2,3-dioxygenase-like lactoylglutathione lyase family enzyme
MPMAALPTLNLDPPFDITRASHVVLTVRDLAASRRFYETEPVRWDPNDADVSFPWGLPAQRSWFEQATPFENRTVVEPPVKASPLTLEEFLAQKV